MLRPSPSRAALADRLAIFVHAGWLNRTAALIASLFLSAGAFSAIAQTSEPVRTEKTLSAPADAEVRQLRLELARVRASQRDLEHIVDSAASEVGLRTQLKELRAETGELKAALTAAGAAPAPETEETGFAGLTAALDRETIALNILWTLIAGFMVMFMQAGFALIETGLTRSKNVAHTMSMNFMVYALGMLGYWALGFALQFGGTGAETSVSTVTSLGPAIGEHLRSEWGFTVAGKFFGILGHDGMFLPPRMLEGGIFALFLFQMVFMDTTATIPTGAMAERWRFLPFCLFSLCVGALIYPIYGNWVWGGGWLAALGKNFGLGHGHVDFAGSSVVHLCGGVIAFIGARIVGPRDGKFDSAGRPTPIPGHNIPMAITGTFILAFGWFGFNSGSTLSAADTQIGVIAVNTMLASGAGAAAGMIATWLRFGRPDPSFMANGMLAGLVAITASCAFVESWAAVLIGVLAGLLVIASVEMVETRLRLDDPVGAISVHGVCGAWGVLALGFFANGRYGDGWNGVEGNVTGLFYGDGGQFTAECIGLAACIVAVGAMAKICFAVIGWFTPHRAAHADQVVGLDGPELGILGYQHDAENLP